ncbi:MAG: tRNA pseudouridine(38-40) synthase TruA [Candidatus Sumerlaeia bacterium]
MPRIKLTLEYDGTNFAGWQRQPRKRTVQGVLEEALGRLCGHEVRTTGAGRTDAGVHAAGQVAHFDLNAPRSPRQIILGGNEHLPPDVAVVGAEPVPDDFDARRDAIARHYRYTLLARRARPAWMRTCVGHTHYDLDEVRVRRGLAVLQGRHDFRAFRSAECEAPRTDLELAVTLTREGDLWVFDFHARSFLHHMIRLLIGALIELGRGRLEPARLRAMLDGGEPRPDWIPNAPASGLCLMSVEYPPLQPGARSPGRRRRP